MRVGEVGKWKWGAYAYSMEWLWEGRSNAHSTNNQIIVCLTMHGVH